MTDKIPPNDKRDTTDEPLSEVQECLKLVDEWSFDVFHFTNVVKYNPLKTLSCHLFDRYAIIQKFAIDPTVLTNFTSSIEDGYKRFNNPYHNNVHATDVTQTMNSVLRKTGLVDWLTDLEAFACLLAAMIHDFEHTGTTNGFHVSTKSERALIYNDRSVQENHHLSASFFLLQKDNCNILSNLSREEYRQLRILVIDLVLATDMAFHFQIQKDIKSRISSPDLKVDKSKALALVLHACDISNPAKDWHLASKWSTLIMEEFFTQGDRERELGLPISPLCDRFDTLIPESQINFLDFIVEPTFKVCSEMLVYILEPQIDKSNDGEKEVTNSRMQSPWVQCISENRRMWQEKTLKVRTSSVVAPTQRTSL